ncbi:MAG: peptide chain release factor N(5)-glutamine methyltransferase [Candidatus Magasanikbacteria bacterium]
MIVKKLLIKNTKIPLLDKEILLAYVIKKSREFLFANPEFEINFWQKIKFEKLIKQRQKNISVAYLIKHKEFFGLDFFVNKNVLVPRPDTEIMVEQVLKEIQNSKFKIQNLLLIDIGTGSGCIPISVIKTLKQENMKTIAVDISKKALYIAKRNAQRHNVDIKFLHGNLLEPVIKILEHGFNKSNEFVQIVLTANLPYITEQQFQTEPSIQQEPKLALVADNEGLALYEELLKQIVQLLSSFLFPHSSFLYFEIDPTQTEKIKILIKKYLPKANIEIKKDLSGLDRLVIIK